MSDHVEAISQAPPGSERAAGLGDGVDGGPVTDAAVQASVAGGRHQVEDDEGQETVDGVPVLVQARPLTVAHAPLPAVQAAAVAATGFVAGAATLALVRRHSARKLARRSVPRRAADMLPIVGSRSFIVDVHLLAKPGE